MRIGIIGGVRSSQSCKSTRCINRNRSLSSVRRTNRHPAGGFITSLDRLGFAGRIYPVNPNYAAVLNRPCYASVADLPEAPDVAVFCLGHERVIDAFIAGSKRGMKA